MCLVLFVFYVIVVEESDFSVYSDSGLLLLLNFINPDGNVYRLGFSLRGRTSMSQHQASLSQTLRTAALAPLPITLATPTWSLVRKYRPSAPAALGSQNPHALGDPSLMAAQACLLQFLIYRGESLRAPQVCWGSPHRCILYAVVEAVFPGSSGTGEQVLREECTLSFQSPPAFKFLPRGYT